MLKTGSLVSHLKINKEKKNLDLLEVVEVSIKRHVKIRADASPYQPEYQQYFMARKAKASLMDLRNQMSV